MNKTSTTAAAFALILASSGCLSETELEARRQWAFDLSGTYDEARAEGVQSGALAIENQADKNDVKATFSRGALYDGEQAFVDLLQNDADKEAVLAAMLFGEGDDDLVERVVGGDNYSSDFGATSEVHVSGRTFDANPGVAAATGSKVSWNLFVAIENGSDALQGRLDVEFREQRPKATDATQTETHLETESFAVAFTRQGGPIEADRCEDCVGEGTDDGAEDAEVDDDGVVADEG